MKPSLLRLFASALAALAAWPGSASAQTPAASTDKKPPVIILKLDDVTRVSKNFTRIADFLKSRNIKSSFGIICNSLEGDKQPYYAWIKGINDTGLVEFWCHGYDHKMWKDDAGKDLQEFKGVPYETQKEHLAKCQELAKSKLGFPFITFGAPFNATDDATMKALAQDPDWKIFLYGTAAQAAQAPNLLVLDRTQMNIENPIFVPNTARVQHDLEILRPKREYFVIQGHPDQWDEGRLAEFGKMIDYLCSQGVIFATPKDYYLYKQDPAKNPLPAPSTPATTPQTLATAPPPPTLVKPKAPVATGTNSSIPASTGENLVKNGDFEQGKLGWSIFAPAEAQSADVKFDVTGDDPHSGSQCAVMSSAASARFAMVNFVSINPTPGDRYRVSAWVRAGKDFMVEPKTPGTLLRVSMFADAGGTQSTGGGLFYLGFGNKAVAGPDVSIFNDQGVPETWTKIEGVFEVQPGTAKLNVCGFVWKGSGSLYFDDFELELVDKSTPLSAQPTAK